MIIDTSLLSSDALEGLIDEYCLRDWGLNETESPIASRRDYVRRALDSGELVIKFSEVDESAHIVSSETLGIR